MKFRKKKEKNKLMHLNNNSSKKQEQLHNMKHHNKLMATEKTVFMFANITCWAVVNSRKTVEHHMMCQTIKFNIRIKICLKMIFNKKFYQN